MPIDIEQIVEKALSDAFAKSLEEVVRNQAELAFTKAFANGSPLASRLEEKVAEGIQRFFEEGIRWKRKKTGFRK